MAEQAPQPEAARVQLCGRLVARVGGRRIEGKLPGRQGRILFAYLVLQRDRAVARDEIAEAIWARRLPADPGLAVAVLLSKIRKALPAGALESGGDVRLDLGPGARVDLEAARDAIHRAESLIAAGDHYAAIGPGLVASNISERRFLPGAEAPWIDEVRRELDEIRLRTIEAAARRGLGIGGREVQIAERHARRLVDLAPYRESACALLMEALERQGNVAEGLRAYERLRAALRDELGAAPSAKVQRIHERLLRQGDAG